MAVSVVYCHVKRSRGKGSCCVFILKTMQILTTLEPRDL